MANINRVSSPMNLYEEDLLKTREELNHIKSELLRKQSQSPAFLIGSIDRVNDKIAHLDQELQSYTALVVESRASNYDEDYGAPVDLLSPERRQRGYQKEKEARELNRFAGLYSIKATLLPQVNTKVKQLAKFPAKKDKSNNKPKLVELHQYPGFDANELTPLPDVEAFTILQKVARAHKDLDRKPYYKEEFKRLLYSRMSEAVLVDTFWWIFLNKYHPSKISQSKLFNRIAHNYVKLLIYAKEPKYRDVFFKNYPELLAQCIYSSFCEAFPSSWRQFDDDFKSDICDLTSLWIAGVKPVPRFHMSWNYKDLEPQGMKKAEAISKSKKGNILDLDFLSVESSRSSNDASTVSDTSPTSSVVFSTKPSKTDRRKPSLRRDTKVSNASSTTSSTQSESDYIGSVSDAQKQISPRSVKPASTNKLTKQKMNLNGTDFGVKMRTDALTPITENTHFESEDMSEERARLPIHRQSQSPRKSVLLNQQRRSSLTMDGKLQKPYKYRSPDRSPDRSSNHSKSPRYMTKSEADMTTGTQDGAKSSKSGIGPTQQSYTSITHVTSMSTMRPQADKKKRESHPACRGPDFIKTMFNVHSQSPLVAHFLNQKGLHYDVGTNVIVQRTEVKNLPPLDAPTYREIINDAFQSVKMLDESYKMMYDESTRATGKFIKDQKEQYRAHMRRENALLSRGKEVKRLSDLLVLELLKDADEMTTGAAQAVEAALMEQDQQ
ncbi:protein FAM227A-like [Ptychodera flava]|uniref:protein FAM227A-like n=1 Tax=Ptychodera flava TaxID=63121 RepID=UPI00396AB0AF